ncbi:MAG TPA: zinc ribbon domain-containing protein [Deltaproteobacteria bacterium]|nr:zinc ribbon domain-containing protein [Deltaproteobacteria bacterium]
MDTAADEGLKTGHFYGRAVLFLALVWWGIRFSFAPMHGDHAGSSFMHLINLPFHEAGHLIFSVFGDFMRVFGGALAQILAPIVCVIAFLRRQDAFAASCSLWWVGQSFTDVAPYIYDARAGELMLLGGVTGRDEPDFHDWHNILERLDLLPYDHVIAYLTKAAGVIAILLSLGWACYALIRQYRMTKHRRA